MEMLIGVLIVTWFLKNAVVDGAYAVRGQDSPRVKRRLAELEAAKSNGGVVPRAGMSGYFADLWADAWTGASARHAAKLADPKPQRTPWFQRPGARGFFARRWNAAWDRFDSKFAVPTAPHPGPTPQYDDSWLERVVDGTYGDAPTATPPPAPQSLRRQATRKRGAAGNSGPSSTPPPPASIRPQPLQRPGRSARPQSSPTHPFRLTEPVAPGELPREQKDAITRISQMLKDANGKPVSESAIVADLAERGIDRENALAALTFMAKIGDVRRESVRVTDTGPNDSNSVATGAEEDRGPVPPRMPVGTPPEDLREAVDRIRRLVEEADGELVSPEKILEMGAAANIPRQDLLRGLNYLVEGGYLKSIGPRDEAGDSNVIPIRPDLGDSPTKPTGSTNREEIRNMFVPQSDGTRRQAAKAVAEQLVGEMAGQLGSLDLLTASLATEGVQGDIFTVLAGYRDRFAVMDGAATELNELIDAHGIVTDAYMNSGTQAPRDFVAPTA